MGVVVNVGLAVCVFVMGMAFHDALNTDDKCRVVELPKRVEFAARGGKPGGFWIADGRIVGVSLEEDDPVVTLACHPEW